MGIYDDLLDTAVELIAEFGKSISILRASSVAADPWNPTVSEATHLATGVLTSYESNEVDGSLIKVTDKRLMISTDGLAIVPSVSDRVTVDGQTYQVVRVNEIRPGDATLAYDVQVRL